MEPTLNVTDTLPVKDGFVVIDARGHRCPVPTLKLRREMMRLKNHKAGVILWANDPMAQIDVPHFCNQNNYLLISVDRKDEVLIFTIGASER